MFSNGKFFIDCFVFFDDHEHFLSDSFCLNPQCGLQLSDPDKEDNMCTAVIALMQKFARNRKDKPENITNYLYLIGFHVYNVINVSFYLSHS